MPRRSQTPASNEGLPFDDAPVEREVFTPEQKAAILNDPEVQAEIRKAIEKQAEEQGRQRAAAAGVTPTYSFQKDGPRSYRMVEV